jgi:E3 ubiquitin-protein ligase HECTD1
VSTATGGGLFGPGTKSVSSLVRFALSSNFPSGLLNTAQSYPTLNLGGPPASGGVHPAGVPVTASMSETDQVELRNVILTDPTMLPRVDIFFLVKTGKAYHNGGGYTKSHTVY